jgi:hypothetical protein
MTRTLVFLTLSLAFAAAPRPGLAAAEPVACAIGVFSAAEFARHAELTRRLAAAVVTRRALADGWSLRLGERAALGDVGEWISLERRCCPFLKFRLAVGAARGAELVLTGPPGTRDVIAAALEPATPR